MRFLIPLSLAAQTVLSRFRRDRRASAAVEFAFIAPLFFGLLFAIIEVALIFFAGQTLETATQSAARLILTGQAQTANYTAAQFKTDLCGQIVALFDCQNGIYVDVQSGSSFSNVSATSPLDANKNFVPAGLSYHPGGAGDTVIVTVYYQWPIFMPNLGFNPTNYAGNKYLMSATAAFRNEPYGG